MRFNIVDEGIVWKNPYPNFRAMVTWHGHTENLGGGHLIHTARVGKTKLGLDGKCEVYVQKIMVRLGFILTHFLLTSISIPNLHIPRQRPN